MRGRIPMWRFEQMVATALDDLPEEWAARLENLVIQVEDEPSREDLESVDMVPGDPSDDLLGLYQGVPLGERGSYAVELPDRIVVYRGPTLRASRNRHEVIRIVQETVLHEVGHHFGLEEDDLPF